MTHKRCARCLIKRHNDKSADMVVPESPSGDAALRAEQDLASNGDALASSRLHEKVIEAKEEQVRAVAPTLT